MTREKRAGDSGSSLCGALLRSAAFVAAAALPAFALAAPGPAEAPCPAHLFVLARSKNANIVVYDGNRGPAGDFVASEPVVAYWLLNGDESKREELSAVERNRAYGFDVKAGGAPGTYAMTFNAGRKRHLTIRVLDGCPVAIAPFSGKKGILRRMFVQAKEGAVWPKVDYVEFFGEDVATGAPLYEKFVPGK